MVIFSSLVVEDAEKVVVDDDATSALDAVENKRDDDHL